jgi:parallel beta-helix repeat protein
MELGYLSAEAGDWQTARSSLEESLRLGRQWGDEHGIALTRSYLGIMAVLRGEHDSARAHLEESLGVLRRVGALPEVKVCSFYRGLLSFNGLDGLGVFGSTSNRIERNSIFSNGDLGIDLAGGTESTSGATANDAGDTDTGPNNLQNKPVLSSAVTSSGSTTIEGRLNSTPDKTFTLQFFSNPSNDNEGRRFIGQQSVSTNSNGVASINFSPARAVLVGQRITASATDSGGNTSEFSVSRQVAAQQ